MVMMVIVFLAGLIIGVGVGMSMRKAPAAQPVVQQAPVKAVAQTATSDSAVQAAWLPALGGAGNVKEAEAIAATRVRVTLLDGAKLNESALKQAGVQAVAAINAQVFHLIVGPKVA
ncbi:PTS transporter subunit EIIB [Chitinibacter bivalviorum]|uniref:PTS transporter subunit EIIB n=1 Tax=Chitinibacter bivalviorum TaxID=2739434 RepID=A0A7H9BKL2_9NEIS|nr:PTS transporter subunit EIIB [Chitinibacter bivalviorum]QLG89215.1 PTS transporter subunit EIIB [Chitinibacter bivalviorum]